MKIVPHQTQERHHFLDGLRAAMMLLGVFLHSRLVFTANLPDADAVGSTAHTWCELAFYFIHLFRMPVFFLIAGFCAALIYERRGAKKFASNRFTRIVLPLAIAWIVLYPIVRAGHFFTHGNNFASCLDHITSGAFLERPRLSYLWFLQYLAIYCGLALVLTPLVGRTPAAYRIASRRVFDRIVSARSAPYVLSITSVLVMLSMNRPFMDHSIEWIPNWRPLLGYWAFFLVGWALYGRPLPFESFQKHLVANTNAAIVTTALYLYLMSHTLFENPQRQLLISIPLASAASWLWVYAIVGAGARFMNCPSATVRYISEAAYWMYLVHFPIVVWAVGITALLALGPWTQYGIVLACAVCLPLISYHLFVRGTRFGELLGSKRTTTRMASIAVEEASAIDAHEPSAPISVPALRLFDPAQRPFPVRVRIGARRRHAA